MSELLLPALDDFPIEASCIGRLLASYAVLEIDLMYCVNASVKNFDTVLKVMFRTRGESARIDSADALARHKYHALGHGSRFEQTIGDVKYCVKIRNEYAHCVWHNANDGHLTYLNIEKLAKRNEKITSLSNPTLTYHKVDLNLLRDQVRFFENTSKTLKWLNFQAAATANGQALATPHQIQRPPLHI